MLTVGLDVHKQFTYACILNDEGAVVHTERFDSTPQAIEQFGQKRLARDCQVALEATTNCLAFAKLLRRYAGQVTISNPMQTKAIAHALKIPVKNWTWIRGQSGLKLDMGGGWGISSLCALG